MSWLPHCRLLPPDMQIWKCTEFVSVKWITRQARHWWLDRGMVVDWYMVRCLRTGFVLGGSVSPIRHPSIMQHKRVDLRPGVSSTLTQSLSSALDSLSATWIVYTPSFSLVVVVRSWFGSDYHRSARSVFLMELSRLSWLHRRFKTGINWDLVNYFQGGAWPVTINFGHAEHQMRAFGITQVNPWLTAYALI